MSGGLGDAGRGGGNSGDVGGSFYKAGGIVNKPTEVTIGEGGKSEAVVPLERGYSPSQAIHQLIMNERRTKGVNKQRGGLPLRSGAR